MIHDEVLPYFVCSVLALFSTTYYSSVHILSPDDENRRNQTILDTLNTTGKAGELHLS